ncbi:MAG TPA: FeS-binding protein [Anaerolineae bacterium]|nr:FeS-binding protein [Anaerolineae bacterium]
MPTRTLRLNYPPSLLRQPILNQLILHYKITVNIRQAQITLEEGWLEIEAEGEAEEIEHAISWLEEEGIEVIPID